MIDTPEKKLEELYRDPRPDRDFLSMDDIAEALDLSLETIRRAVRDGSLIAYSFGKEYRIHKYDYREWVESKRGKRVPGGRKPSVKEEE